MMSQQLSPSAALGGAFELPPVAPELSRQRNRQVRGADTLNTYALELRDIGLLLPVDTPSALIEDELPSCQLPNTPSWLDRMVSWNGLAVPVFHLEELLEYEKTETKAVKLLIIGQGDDAVGVRVTTTPFRIILRSEEKLTRNPPLPPALQPFTRACYRTTRIWVDWDYRGFFDAVARRF